MSSYEVSLASMKQTMDLDVMIAQLYKKQLLAEPLVELLCTKTKELLMTESNVVQIQAPVTVVGDIHGLIKNKRRVDRAS